MKKNLLVVAVLLFTASLGFGQLNNGLVAHYDFNGNANDKSGNSLNASINTAIPTSDRFGNSNNAYKFLGDTSTYIQVPHDTLLNLRKDKSISFWFKIDTIPTQKFPGIIYKEGPKTSFPTFGFQLNHDNGYALKDRFKVGFWFGSGNANKLLSVKPSYLDTANMGKWTHILATYSYSTGWQKIYYNGVISDSANVGILLSDTSSKPMQIGRSTSFGNFENNRFRGSIDDIRIYNRVVNDSEADSLFNQPNPVLSSIDKVNVLQATKVYPNPSSQQITISNIIEDTELSIFDITGKIIISGSLSFDDNTVDVSKLSKGIYTIMLNTKHNSKTHKLVIE